MTALLVTVGASWSTTKMFNLTLSSVTHIQENRFKKFPIHVSYFEISGIFLIDTFKLFFIKLDIGCM